MTGFLRAGHLPTLAAALLYFDVSVMVWVLLGPLALGSKLSDLWLKSTQTLPVTPLSPEGPVCIFDPGAHAAPGPAERRGGVPPVPRRSRG
jgi:hypothetical protein